jgi:NAD+ kinase
LSTEVVAPAAVRTAVVFTHTQPDQTAAALRAAAEAAGRASCTLFADSAEVRKHGAGVSGLEACEELPKQVDLCLVLGGDGAILRALRTYAGANVPIFGINFGTIGFLAAAERKELETALQRAFMGEFQVMTLPGLAPEIDTAMPIALNDVSFIRKPHGRVAELSYRLGGQEVGHVRCDGLVAATPAGSTGYNLANQGPILAWGVKGYVVSYISPHSLTARALVVAPGDVLHVDNAPEREPVEVAVDGGKVADLSPGAELEVRFLDSVSRLAQLPGTSFYQRIREKFGHLAV